MPLKKRLGQHLLTDTGALRRIAAATGAGSEDFILEIGPGTGLLTSRLLDTGARVTAVELDDEMANRLHEKYGREERLTIVRGDILETPIPDLVPEADRPAMACGNLPYYISSPIIFRLLDHADLFRNITVLVQKEVGVRMCAGPGSRDYGMLSVFCAVAADCKKLFTIKSKSFRPPPKVDSVVVNMSPKSRAESGIEDEKTFSMVVHGAFEHRRKTCYNSLRISAGKGGMKELFSNFENADDLLKESLAAAGIDPAGRPETIGHEAYVKLANDIYRRLNDKQKV